MKHQFLFILCIAILAISCANTSKPVNSAAPPTSAAASASNDDDDDEIRVNPYENADLPPLHEACNHDVIDKDLVRKLVAEGHDVNEFAQDGLTPIRIACNRSHIDKEAIKLLVELGARIKTTEINRYTYDYSPLTFACDRSDIDVDAVRLLFELGASPRNTWEKTTPLMKACDRPEIDEAAIRLLAEKGDNINAVDYYERSLAMIALDHKRVDRDAIKVLIESGLKVNLGHGPKKNKLITMVVYDLELTRLVVERGEKSRNSKDNPLQSLDADGTGVLSYAAAWGNADVVRYLLDHGLSQSINQPNKNGITPIFFAAYSGNLEIVKMLVDAGADVHHKTNSGENVLMAAVRGKDNDVVFSSIQTNTHLHYASRMLYDQAPDPEMIQYLIDLKVPAYESDEIGLSALHLAARNPHAQPEVIRMLIKAGGDVNGETHNKHRTPLMYAENPEVAAALIKKGADIHAVDVNGWTALHHAIDDNRIETAKLLIQKGSDIHTKTNSGKEAADLADTTKSIELLGSMGVDFTDALYNELRRSRPVFHPKELMALFKSSKVGDLSEWSETIIRGISEISEDHLTSEDVAQVIGYIKDHGVDLNHSDERGRSLLMLSCNEAPVIFSELIRQGADINLHTAMSTPLAFCASSGFGNRKTQQNIRLLIEKGADVNASNSDGIPVIVSLAKWNPDLVPIALQAGANPNASDSKGNTALMVTKSYRAARALIDAGANVNATRYDGASVVGIHSGAENNAGNYGGWLSPAIDKSQLDSGDFSFVKMLVDAGAQADARTIQYISNPKLAQMLIATKNDVLLTGKQIKEATYLTPEMVKRYLATGGSQQIVDEALNDACFWGIGSKITALAKGGGNPNTRSHYKNRTPLIMAAFESETGSDVPAEAIQALIDAGARIEDTDEDGNTALMAACSNYRPNAKEIIDVLLNAGANVKKKDNDGQNILFWISNVQDYPELVQKLVQRGADIHATDKEGNTPLHACWNPKTCQALINAGVKLNARNKDGMNALMFNLTDSYGVAAEKLPELCETLINAGIDLKATDKSGKTALYYAVISENISCTEAMIDAGIPVNAKDKQGKTVIEYIREDHPFVDKLKRHGATGSPIQLDPEAKRRLEEKRQRRLRPKMIAD